MIRPHNGNRGPVLGRSVEQPRPGLPDGKVRCPACETIVSLTSKGRLWAHNTPRGEPCAQRIVDGLPVHLDEIPPIVLPPQRRGRAGSATRESETASRTGRCHTCDKPVTGERAYCGRCLSRRL